MFAAKCWGDANVLLGLDELSRNERFLVLVLAEFDETLFFC
ncbi:hypothetical protein [Pseudovibrio ascidiaceicola]|nr:hypothetical protein [Pseudovibrio ascidiaceicola]